MPLWSRANTKTRRLGEEVIYTGQGGRDPATGKQISDQELTRGNLGLVITRNKGLPLRVIRKVMNSADTTDCIA